MKKKKNKIIGCINWQLLYLLIVILITICISSILLILVLQPDIDWPFLTGNCCACGTTSRGLSDPHKLFSLPNCCSCPPDPNSELCYHNPSDARCK